MDNAPKISGQEKSNVSFVLRVSCVAALGGLLFGYDTAVIAGAIGFLEKKFLLSPAMVGWVASSAIWGCAAGVLLAGRFGDVLGRKKALILTALLFGLSGIGSAVPNNLTVFIIARFSGGLAIGAVSMLAPLYISEIAPASIRGRLVTLYQLAIVLGINLIYYVNLEIEASGDLLWNIEMGWRWMLGSETIPALLFLFLMFFVPESPRWLIAKGDESAQNILQRLHGDIAGRRVFNDIVASLKNEKVSIMELFRPTLRAPLAIAVVLAFFSQVTGINAIIYYAPEILKRTGIATDSAMMQTFMIGLVNTLFTLVALWLVDRLGRRKLLLLGVSGMALCLFGTGYCFNFNITGGPWLLIFILGYIACFASSLGPIPWIIMSEIFPNRTRSMAMSVATVILWFGVIIVTQLTPILLDSIGGAWMFWIFMINSLILFTFTWLRVPETKGLTLEEIEMRWNDKQQGPGLRTNERLQI
ncbi:MFS transporter [Chryseolinea soli]|uniref:MFS transporter n=2 Tax=Chryseolinea soli TaxID=2321403 RepID=A0A385T3M9_9BACT|nr:MFS transporter [Chryseolinea soli]